MSAARLLSRALAVACAQTLLQAALVALLASALSLSVAIPNTAILFLATSVLGAVWAARQRLSGSRGSPSVAAALVPLIASLVYVAPRLVLGPREPALLTLAAIALVAPLSLRAWSGWVVPELPAHGRMITSIAPLAAVGLAAATIAPLAGVVALVLACALAALMLHRDRRAERDAEAFASWVRSVEVRPEALVCPAEMPVLRDRALARALADLRLRAQQLTSIAGEDAAAQDPIAEARELRTRFMASMSHELKSPLNSIVGFSQVLEGGLDGELSAGQRESVAMIRAAAEELILLLTDILDLARLEAGKLALHRQWTPSVEILTDAIQRARAFVQGQDVQIEAELQPGLPPVHVDKHRIVQAVVGLFRNVAPSLVKTTIRLRARVASGPPGPSRHLRVEVHDALGAIPHERIERIFEAFQEVSTPSGRRLGGLGMAITLSRGLVRMHGGEVWADSSPEAGTVLCVAIPLDAPPAVTKTPASAR